MWVAAKVAVATGAATVTAALPPAVTGRAATIPRKAAALAPRAATRVAPAEWLLPIRRGASVIVLAAAVLLVVGLVTFVVTTAVGAAVFGLARIGGLALVVVGGDRGRSTAVRLLLVDR